MPTASFDVFDTLLVRTCAEPRDLFVALGQTLQRQGLLRLPPEDFATLRWTAEKKTRTRAPAGEVQLVQIYAELAGQLTWNQAQQTTAMQQEIALEKAGIRPAPGRREIVREARRRCGRVIFLSDMYLPGAVIREWLEDAGFFEQGDELFVSGETGVGKGQGGLFRHVRAQLQSNYKEWTHWGDHPVADAASPKKLGISVCLNQDTRLIRHERSLRGTQRFALPWRSQLAGAARLARLEARPALSVKQRVLWEVGTTVAGPLFWGFTRWCLAEAKNRGIADLYFLARGGQIFWRVASLLQTGHSLRCHYLHTSRLAFAGTFDAGDPARLRQLAAPSLTQHSARQALANLGLEESGLELPARWPRDRWDDNLSVPERVALADWLLSGERLPRVQQALRTRAALAREYLRQAGLERTGNPAAVVDTGWMGTIQKNMEHLLGDASGPRSLHGFYLGLTPVREFACQGECRAYTNTFRRLSLRRETTHLILLEIMAQGTHGPLLGFHREGGRVEPDFGPFPDAQREDVELFQAAVLAFVWHAEETVAARMSPAALAPVLIDNYLDFFHHPDELEARILGGIPHADQMLEQRKQTLCREMSLGAVLRSCLDFKHRPPGWWLAGQARLGHAPWLHGYMVAKKLKWMIQSAVTGKPD